MDTAPASRKSSQQSLAFLHLLRPAHAPAALGDVLAGGLLAFALGSPGTAGGMIWLAIAGTCLYAGNAALDYKPPEAHLPAGQNRPPRGGISRGAALFTGLSLLLAGITCGALVGRWSAVLATAIALFVLLYHGGARHRILLAPVCMGLGRGLNFLLGMSLSTVVMAEWWPLMLLPALLTTAATAMHKGYRLGDLQWVTWGASPLLLAVIAGLLLLGTEREFQTLVAMPFIGYFAACALPPFLRAALQHPALLADAPAQALSLSMIPLNAAIVAGFGGIVLGGVILILQPLTLSLCHRLQKADSRRPVAAGQAVPVPTAPPQSSTSSHTPYKIEVKE